MQTFNDRVFSLAANDGICLIFDIKGSRRLYFKVTCRQAYDLFCVKNQMADGEGREVRYVQSRGKTR